MSPVSALAVKTAPCVQIEGKRRSDRESMCRDKSRSLESGCLRVKKVSADGETRNVVNRRCVGKLGEREGEHFQVCLG